MACVSRSVPVRERCWVSSFFPTRSVQKTTRLNTLICDFYSHIVLLDCLFFVQFIELIHPDPKKTFLFSSFYLDKNRLFLLFLCQSYKMYGAMPGATFCWVLSTSFPRRLQFIH